MTFLSDWSRIRKKYAGSVGPIPFYIIVTFLFGIFSAILNIILTLFSRVLFDYVGPLHSKVLLISLLKIGLVFVFGKFLVSVVSNVIDTLIATQFREKISTLFFNQILRLPLATARKYDTGDLINRLHSETGSIKVLLLDIPGSCLLSLTVFTFYIHIVYSMNHFVTLLVLIGIPINLMQTRYFSSKLVIFERKALNLQSRLLTFLQERLSRIPLIKAFGRETAEKDRYSGLIHDSNQVLMASKITQIIRAMTSILTLDVWRMIIMWYLIYCIVIGRMTNGEVVALMMLTRVVDQPVDALSALYTQWKLAMVSLGRIDEITSEITEKTDVQEVVVQGTHLKADLRFESVSFSYPDRKDVLRDISLSASIGQPIAIVGPSGAGKTTLVNLLSQFIVPSQGRILINDLDSIECGPATVRKMVGVVSQESRFYQSTLRDNLAFSNTRVTDADIMNAIDRVGLSSLYEQFPCGLDTIINEDVLSGGQKQRFSLARTLLQNPPLLIFDEVTSSLDAIQEARIRDLMATLSHEKTVIIIAHRLSTIRWVKNIYVLWNGLIVENGDYDSLLKKRGYLYLLHTLQNWSFGEFRHGIKRLLDASAMSSLPFAVLIITSDERNNGILSFFGESMDHPSFDHLVTCCFPTDSSAMFLFGRLDETHQEKITTFLLNHVSDMSGGTIGMSLLLIDVPHLTAEEYMDRAMICLDRLRNEKPKIPIVTRLSEGIE